MQYNIVEGADAFRPADAARLLQETYWAHQRSAEKIEASMRRSDCWGVVAEETNQLVGFARVITDGATTYYLCDVVIDPAHRQQGLGKRLVSAIVSAPRYAGLRGLLLTRDAHGLYRQFGFESAADRAMVRRPE